MPKFVKIVGVFLYFLTLSHLFAQQAPKTPNQKPEKPQAIPPTEGKKAKENLKKKFYSELSAATIQHEGRLKPLATFSRVTLTLFHGKKSIKTTIGKDKEKKKIDSIHWLWHLVSQAEQRFAENDFIIRNPELLTALGIEANNRKYFSSTELRRAFALNFANLHQVFQKQEEQKNLLERQISEIYYKNLLYYKLSSSLTCLIPNLKINSQIIADELEAQNGKKISYFDIINKQKRVRFLITALEKQQEGKLGNDVKSTDISIFINQLNQVLQNRDAFQLRIIPPALPHEENWLSPWELMDGRYVTDWQKTLLDNLQSALKASTFGDYKSALQNLENFNKITAKKTTKTYSQSRKFAELIYEKADLFTKSLTFYILGFLLLTFLFLFKQYKFSRKFLRFAGWSLIIGLVIHTIALAMRVYIMARPPVSTLYESIIFVAFISVFGCLIFAKIKDKETGYLMAALAGSVLIFISLKYNKEGDSMGMLRAVLDSNFWLSTHVVTITIGYGCAFIAGLIAHAYLFISAFFQHARERRQELFKSLGFASILALFFTTLGTILGGIWGDQSWGRFWGWDPKENGALLIVLWLTLALHGKVSGLLKGISFAACLALVNICVILAWFGVNLLNVGLHTYGATENIGRNIIIACVTELIIILTLFIISKSRNQPVNVKIRVSS